MSNIINRKTNPLKSGFDKVAKILKLTSIEKELEQSKSYLSIALQGIEHGEWNWNMSTNEIDLSPDAQAILGYEKKGKVLDQDSFLETIHHGDRSNLLYSIEKHKKGITDYVSVDIRMKSAYGHWNWINLRGKIVEFDEAGVPLSFTGINYDINERRQYDDDVQELQEKVIKSQEKEKKDEKNAVYINGDLDRYSKFRMNGLRNILKSN